MSDVLLVDDRSDGAIVATSMAYTASVAPHTCGHQSMVKRDWVAAPIAHDTSTMLMKG